MSAFGGVEFDFSACEIDFLVSSANKCVQGVPGFGFALCRRTALESHRRSFQDGESGSSGSMARTGGERPVSVYATHSHATGLCPGHWMNLRQKAVSVARAARYHENHETCIKGMRAIGFEEYVPPDLQGHIITSFLYPTDNFDFEEFYDRLNKQRLRHFIPVK